MTAFLHVLLIGPAQAYDEAVGLGFVLEGACSEEDEWTETGAATWTARDCPTYDTTASGGVCVEEVVIDDACSLVEAAWVMLRTEPGVVVATDVPSVEVAATGRGDDCATLALDLVVTCPILVFEPEQGECLDLWGHLVCDPVIAYTCAPAMLYEDGDGDGWGGVLRAVGCPGDFPHLVSVDGDCDDQNGAIYPHAVDGRADRIDFNCYGSDL
jgi:hypothetical protein